MKLLVSLSKGPEHFTWKIHGRSGTVYAESVAKAIVNARVDWAKAVIEKPNYAAYLHYANQHLGTTTAKDLNLKCPAAEPSNLAILYREVSEGDTTQRARYNHLSKIAEDLR